MNRAEEGWREGRRGGGDGGREREQRGRGLYHAGILYMQAGSSVHAIKISAMDHTDLDTHYRALACEMILSFQQVPRSCCGSLSNSKRMHA